MLIGKRIHGGFIVPSKVRLISSFNEDGQHIFRVNHGGVYEREQITERIAGIQQRQEEEQQRPEFQGMPRIFFIHSELRLVVDLQTCVKAQQSRAYARKVALSNLQEMARTIAYIQEQGIGTVDKLAEAADRTETEYKQASADLRETQNALTAVNERIHYTGQYLSHKALYRQFLSAEDKGAFRAAHKKEIDEYEDAVSHLKAVSPDGTFPPMKELKAEKSRLTRQRDQQKATLRSLTEQRKQMQIIAENVKATITVTGINTRNRLLTNIHLFFGIDSFSSILNSVSFI